MTLLIFAIVIGILVFVHELGHFVMAKRAGMKVEEFGFGFPPRIWGIKKGETIYSINLIPFGGFVKIFGEDGESRGEDKSFTSKKIRTRLGVIVAGVVMNFLLAMVLLMFGNFLGLRVGVFDDTLAQNVVNKQIQIVSVAQSSPASEGDLRILDEILAFRENGQEILVSTLSEVQNYISEHEGQQITIVIKRGGEILEKNLSPRIDPPAGEGPTGISLALTGEVKYPWYESIWRGVRDAGILFVNILLGYGLILKTLIFEGRLMADVSGPIGIATLTGQAARVSFTYLMQFVAMISMNLAVLNIIPFPALDGGRLALLIVEKLRGNPLSKKVEGSINAIGFALLLLLMIFITVKDVGRYF